MNDRLTKRRRWCPGCLVEDRIASTERGEPPEAACWQRACRDVRSVGAYATHRIGLSDACPACGAAQGWLGPSIDACGCGADLAVSPAAASEGSYGRASAYVSGCLGFSQAGSVPLLDGLALKDALTAFERLGECAMLGHRLKRIEGEMPGRALPGTRASWWPCHGCGVSSLSSIPSCVTNAKRVLRRT